MIFLDTLGAVRIVASVGLALPRNAVITEEKTGQHAPRSLSCHSSWLITVPSAREVHTLVLRSCHGIGPVPRFQNIK